MGKRLLLLNEIMLQTYANLFSRKIVQRKNLEHQPFFFCLNLILAIKIPACFRKYEEKILNFKRF